MSYPRGTKNQDELLKLETSEKENETKGLILQPTKATLAI